MYAEGEADNQNFDRTEYDRRKALREAERLAALAGSLPVTDRDKYYRDKTHEARLEPEHRADLERRGLTAEQIAGLPIWSAKGYGYGIAFPDLNGRLHGAQWRLDDADGGKYIWNAGLPGGQKLAIDEMPIAVYKSTNPVMIALVEGTGVKPLLAAQRLNAIAVGAAGGLHTSSPQQLAAVMEAYPCLPVVIVPDAGDVVNVHVMHRHANTAAKLPEAKFLWWGQKTKAESDIDELTGEEFKQISAAAFLSLGASKPSLGHQCFKADQDRLEAAEQAEESFRLSERFAQLIGWVRKPQKRKQRDQVETITLPPSPSIVISDRNEIFRAYEAAVEAGHKHVLDRRGTGSGKSYSAGLLDPKRFAITTITTEDSVQIQNANLWYFSKESRNPSTITTEMNFEVLPVRNHGMVPDSRKITPSGRRVTRPVFDLKDGIGKGNCQNAHLFILAGEKNFPSEGQEASNNPICAACPFNAPREGEKGSECANHDGEGYGFRHQRREAMATERIRLNPQSAPSEIPVNTIGIWEEVSELLTPTISKLNLADFNAQWASIREHDYELATRLYTVESALRFAMNDESNRWGARESDFAQTIQSLKCDFDAVLAELNPILNRTLDEILDRQPLTNEAAKLHRKLEKQVDRAFKDLEAAHPKSAKYAKTKERFSALHAEALQAQKDAERFEAARANARSQRTSNSIDNLQKAPVQALWAILNILFNPNQGLGGFVAHNGEIVVSLPNERTLGIIKQNRANIYLDATIDPQILCDKLGISPSELFVIESDLADGSNLSHVQITGFGNCSRGRAASTNERLKHLHKGLKKKAAEILGTDDFEVAIVDYKAVEIDADHRHLSDTRGSNASEGKQMMIVHGLPKPNLGAIQSEYAAIVASGYSFEQFYQQRLDAEITQLAGRLRSQLHPDKQFLIYWVTEESLPFEAEKMEAADISWEAASTGQKTARSIFQAIQEAIRQGLKLTQSLLAHLAECSQGYISQWFAERGGWAYWRKLLVGKSADDIMAYRAQLDEVEASMVDYLPLAISDAGDSAELVLAVVDEMYHAFGADAFARIFAGVIPAVRRSIIAALLIGQTDWRKPLLD